MQYLYKVLRPYYDVTSDSWKCFRCNLSFKEESVADMHKEISMHSITKVKSLAV